MIGLVQNSNPNLPSSSNHTSQEVEEALSAFINPQNANMSLEQFASILLKSAIGDGSGTLSDIDRYIQDGLLSIVTQIKEARVFNATYLGHMLSEASIPGMLAYMIALRMGSNTVSREVSIMETRLEPEAIRILCEIVGYDPMMASGTFTSGGTMANITALAIARKMMQNRMGGITKRVVVFSSPLVHYSIPKALDLLGGPKKTINLIHVKTKGLKMDLSDLREKLRRAIKYRIPVMAIIAIAGETETGLVDNLNSIADIAEQFGNPFIFADGAYGAPYRLSKVKSLFKGLERFNAISIDPHKTIYTPYSTGAVLFKNMEEHAYLDCGVKADYLQYVSDYETILSGLRMNKISLGQKRIEGSMGAGPILSTLAVLRTLGIKGLTVIYDLTIDRINYLYTRLQSSISLEPIHKPELNLLCFTLKENMRKKLNITDNVSLKTYIDKSRLILDDNIKLTGGHFFSSTTLPLDNGKKIAAWRACIMNPRTTDKIIDNAIDNLEEYITRSYTRV